MLEMETERYRLFLDNNFYPHSREMQRKLEEHPSRAEIARYLGKYSVPIEAILNWPRHCCGVLPDLGILRHMIAGNIIIHPFNADQLGPNSYDVTLGSNFMRCQEKENSAKLNAPGRISSIVEDLYVSEKNLFGDVVHKPMIDTYNPFDQGNVQFVWKKGVLEEASYVQMKHCLKFKGINPMDKLIMLFPHEMILAHTEEFIGGVNTIATKISGKSTAGRNMIEICSDADLGNIGFRNRWTLEIRNKSDRLAIPLVVNQSYAQILFFESQISAQSYKGQYQKVEEIDGLIKAWDNNPDEMLLPKMKRLER